ncbi:MAG: hypothetical protein BWZ07_02854 [Alphaproteobacteria bacterium ADurb.BinA280]|nr:MAG: hypothetical protein BWZ07_02854 [Alphaproteobacteria bacterium ADurb.BinA280]
MQSGTRLRGIDLMSIHQRLELMLQVGFAGQLEQRRQHCVVDTLTSEDEMQAIQYSRELPHPVWLATQVSQGALLQAIRVAIEPVPVFQQCCAHCVEPHPR